MVCLDNMEQNESYLAVQLRLHDLQQKQSQFNEANIVKAHADVNREIDEHFEKCFQALVARREAIKQETEKKLIDQRKHMQTIQAQLQEAIDGCNEMIKTGSSLFDSSKLTAEHVWKGVDKFSNPHGDLGKILCTLPLGLINTIEKHGEVSLAETTFSVSAPSAPTSPTSTPTSSPPSSTPTTPNITPTKPLSPVEAFQLSSGALPPIFRRDSVDTRSSIPKTASEPSVSKNHSPALKKKGSEIFRKQTPFATADLVTTVAGSSDGYKDGYGTQSQMDNPCGLFFNPEDGNLYICDSGNNLIRKMTPQGDVSTFARGDAKDKDARLNYPSSIAMFLEEKTFFVTNAESHTISKISPKGVVTCFAGNGKKGHKDGMGTAANFNSPNAITIDQRNGDIYVSDRSNHSIRKITQKGEVTTLAGAGKSGFADGVGKAAKFNRPWGIYFDPVESYLLVCDINNDKLRRVNLNGEVRTMCELKRPSFAVVTTDRTIVVSSHFENRLSRVIFGSNMYEVAILAGSSKYESFDGAASVANFSVPMGIAIDEKSNSCYVADFGSSRIRQMVFARVN